MRALRIQRPALDIDVRYDPLQARAAAVDELLASGALDDPSGLAQDDITRELDALASTSQVDSELAALKASLPGGTAPAGELPAGNFEQPPAPGTSIPQATGSDENLR